MELDSEQLGVIVIGVICLAVAMTALIMRIDKAAEIALGALNGVSAIAGWMGKGMMTTTGNGIS